MTATISPAQLSSELLTILTETFESVQGIFLDRGTSLLETLAGITAEEASIPVGGQCATIAAQVTHLCFYLDVLDRFIKTGQNERVDWGEIWRTVREINPQDWAALQERVRATYKRTCETVQTYDRWDVEHSIGGAVGMIAHTAYHLGEIRQATCMVKKQ
jgi:hypothetical protein